MSTDTNRGRGVSRVAIVTGGSRGLGLAITTSMIRDGWSVVVDGRNARALDRATAALPGPGRLRTVPGDVRDPDHRAELVAEASRWGSIDALVCNASTLGPSPRPQLIDYPLGELRDVLDTNVVANLGLVQQAAGALSPAAAVLLVTSDAAREPYAGWGGYGASKAALEQLGAILAAERPDLRVHVVDPGDLRTAMHQAAFPDEDISDRPLPETVVPALMHLIDDRPSGRYVAAELGQEVGTR